MDYDKIRKLQEKYFKDIDKDAINEEFFNLLNIEFGSKFIRQINYILNIPPFINLYKENHRLYDQLCNVILKLLIINKNKIPIENEIKKNTNKIEYNIEQLNKRNKENNLFCNNCKTKIKNVQLNCKCKEIKFCYSCIVKNEIDTLKKGQQLTCNICKSIYSSKIYNNINYKYYKDTNNFNYAISLLNKKYKFIPNDCLKLIGQFCMKENKEINIKIINNNKKELKNMSQNNIENEKQIYEYKMYDDNIYNNKSKKRKRDNLDNCIVKKSKYNNSNIKEYTEQSIVEFKTNYKNIYEFFKIIYKIIINYNLNTNINLDKYNIKEIIKILFYTILDSYDLIQQFNISKYEYNEYNNLKELLLG